MTRTTIFEIHTNKISEGTTVDVARWVRTPRDSKAGLSFIQLNDGSCHDSLQLVAPEALPNYREVVLELSAGCSLLARGTVVRSEGKGQSLELMVSELNVLGWVEDKDHYPIQPK